MESKNVVDILFNAIEKNYEDVKTYRREDSGSGQYENISDISNCIMSFENYRSVRIQEAYYAKKFGKTGTREVQRELMKLDGRRRSAHDAALSSVNILNRLMESYGFPKLYNGPILTEKELKEHKNYDTIKQYTDFFFDLLVKVEDMSLGKIREKENQKGEASRFGADELISLSRNIQKTTRGYGLTKPILHDEDNIQFDDDER